LKRTAIEARRHCEEMKSLETRRDARERISSHGDHLAVARAADDRAMGNGAPDEVVVFTLDAGGGHRAAANALIAAAAETRSAWRLRALSVQDVLAPLDVARRITGRPMEQTYNDMVRRRRTRFLVPMLRTLQWGIARLHGRLVAQVAAELARLRPAAVVSVVPNFNAVLRDAVRAGCPDVPFLVLLTDFADFPPRFWIVPGIDRVLVGSERAERQARELGIPAARVSRLSGMVLHPRFYPRRAVAVREAVRAELGIPRSAFTALLLFGGKGSPELRPLACALLAESPDWHVVAVCGDNPALFESLAGDEAAAAGRLHRLGFTDRVADYLAACDVLVTKPGPGSLAEAFHQRVPVVVVCNGYTIPQERSNALLVVEQGLGHAVEHWREMPGVVARLARDPGARGRLRAALEALPENRAVYEALALIGREAEQSVWPSLERTRA
jgi:UDP-N-acetylglucosamine:LPS N-acetylglucosamine transferase